MVFTLSERKWAVMGENTEGTLGLRLGDVRVSILKN